MKKLIMILAVILATSVAAFAQSDVVDNGGRTIEEHIESIDRAVQSISESITSADLGNNSSRFSFKEISKSILPLLAVTLSLLLPIAIVLIVYIFRYKNKRNKYMLAEKALAAGMPIPQGLFGYESPEKNNLMAKGIKNVFSGLGLAVFFWFLTGELGLVSIGFMISLIGVGEILIHLVTGKKKEEKPYPGSIEIVETDSNRDTNTGE